MAGCPPAFGGVVTDVAASPHAWAVTVAPKNHTAIEQICRALFGVLTAGSLSLVLEPLKPLKP